MHLELSQRMQGLVWEDQSAWYFSAQLSAILGTAHIAEGGCVSKLREAAETYGIFKLFKPP